MKNVFCILLVLISTVAFAQKAKPVSKAKYDSTVLNAYHIEQLKAFDQQDKDIQTAAAVLQNDRKIFLNAVMGRAITDQDSVTFDAEKSTVRVFKRKVPLPKANN